MRARTSHVLLGLSLTCALTLPAQQPVARTIADAVSHEGSGERVTITGRASVGSGVMQARVFDIAIQDSTGGVRVFSRTQLARVRNGDSLVVTGTLKRYRGDLELIATSLKVVPGTPRPLFPRALPIDATQIGRYPGQLVRIRGRVARSGVSEGGLWLLLTGGAKGRLDSLTLWVPANHGAPVSFSAIAPTDSLVATGIVTAYQDNAEDPVVWQIVPRDSADIVLARHSRPLPAWLGWVALFAVGGLATAIVLGRYTARRQIAALQETETRYRQLLALSPDAVIVHVKGTIRFANPATARLLGVVNEQAVVGRPVEDFVHAESRAELRAATDPASPAAGEATRLRARMLVGGGGTADVEITASPCVYHDQPAVVLLARDITAQLRYERDLHTLALVDELTELANRRGFTLFAQQELARARRNGRTPVLVFADLDGLKHINDTHGHAAGDAALRLVARAFRTMLRETDIVARWSGDEFVALMDDSGEMTLETISDRLATAIATLTPGEQPFRVSATIGLSRIDPELPLADAIARADSALYTHKKRGRRSEEIFTPLSVDAVQ